VRSMQEVALTRQSGSNDIVCEIEIRGVTDFRVVSQFIPCEWIDLGFPACLPAGGWRRAESAQIDLFLFVFVRSGTRY